MLQLSSLFLVIFCGLAVTLSNAADPTVKLNTGYNMPIIGLGTNEIKPEDVDAAINTALDIGYRHIDTGYFYGNQDAIGKSLKIWFEKGNKREDIFITAKLAPFATKGADVEKYLKIQLDKLQLDYVDMFLIHFPWSYKFADPWRPWVNDNTLAEQDNTTDHLGIWKGMEAQVKAGKTKSIGFYTFNESQILRIINHAEIQPSNLQIELQAYNQQKPLRKLAAKHNIVVTGFSPLGSPASIEISNNKSLPFLLEHPTVLKIAKGHKKSPAQILLRYDVQNGIIVIPKSSKPERIKENYDIFDFELTADEMKEINDMDMGEEDSARARKFFHPNISENEFPNLLSQLVVTEIAKAHGKSAAQILIRHTAQGGAVVIRGSKKIAHLKDNLNIFDFELTEDEMKMLDALDKGHKGKIFDYEFIKGVEKHPLYLFAAAL